MVSLSCLDVLRARCNPVCELWKAAGRLPGGAACEVGEGSCQQRGAGPRRMPGGRPAELSSVGFARRIAVPGGRHVPGRRWRSPEAGDRTVSLGSDMGIAAAEAAVRRGAGVRARRRPAARRSPPPGARAVAARRVRAIRPRVLVGLLAAPIRPPVGECDSVIAENCSAGNRPPVPGPVQRARRRVRGDAPSAVLAAARRKRLIRARVGSANGRQMSPACFLPLRVRPAELRFRPDSVLRFLGPPARRRG